MKIYKRIAVDIKTYERLLRRKGHPRKSMDSVIVCLLDSKKQKIGRRPKPNEERVTDIVGKRPSISGRKRGAHDRNTY